jgi:hypothetical protein
MVSMNLALAIFAFGLLSMSIAAANDCHQCSYPWTTSYVSQCGWPQYCTYPCTYQSCYSCDYYYPSYCYYPNYYYPCENYGCQYGYNYPGQYPPFRY